MYTRSVFGLLNQLQNVPLDVIVNVTVTGESLALLRVSCQRRNQSWVFDLLIKVANEGSSCKVGCSHLIDRLLNRLPCLRVDDCNNSINADFLQNPLYVPSIQVMTIAKVEEWTVWIYAFK